MMTLTSWRHIPWLRAVEAAVLVLPVSCAAAGSASEQTTQSSADAPTSATGSDSSNASNGATSDGGAELTSTNCDGSPPPGQRLLRLLTRREYAATVTDLLQPQSAVTAEAGAA